MDQLKQPFGSAQAVDHPVLFRYFAFLHLFEGCPRVGETIGEEFVFLILGERFIDQPADLVHRSCETVRRPAAATSNTDRPEDPPVAIENRRPGTPGWGSFELAPERAIEGYAQTSVAPGDTLAFDMRGQVVDLPVAGTYRDLVEAVPTSAYTAPGALPEDHPVTAYWAAREGLILLEDCAQSHGALYRNAKTGSFGDIACFSFDGIKNITSGEGGCVVTADESVLQKVRDARLLGVEKDTEKRYIGARSWEFDVTMQGWRYHMSNVMAAIGLEQLRSFPDRARARQRRARA